MKKIYHLLIFTTLNFVAESQILKNPYLDYTNQTSPDYKNLNNDPIFETYRSHLYGYYTGEYEIFMDDHFWVQEFHTLAKSYLFETVSFPFTMPCAFQPNSCSDCSIPNRELFMPLDPYDNLTMKWGNFLTNKTEEGFFCIYQGCSQLTTHGFYSVIPLANGNERHQTLVSRMFTSTSFNTTSNNRNYLPHTVLKCTIFLHCDEFESSPIISAFSFYYDNTRGRMRDYPFRTDNCQSNSSNEYDVIFRPEIIFDPYFNDMFYDDNSSNDLWTDGSGTINYFKVSEINSNGCATIGAPIAGDYFYNASSQTYQKPYFYPSSLVASPLFAALGRNLAGYENVTSPLTLLAKDNGIRQNYFIDQNINLNDVNYSSKEIYNPSEVTVTASNLIFPNYYTFRTIRGTLPTTTDVLLNNIVENGGPYSDLRDVPVKTDLTTENTTDAANFPLSAQVATQHLYASRYYLDNYLSTNSKLTIGTCVKLFDCTFDVKQGATMVFNNYPKTIGKEDHGNDHTNTRYKIQTLGGAVLRNYAPIQYLQNGIITQPYPLQYYASNEIYAGKNVDPDSDVPQNDYSIEPGADVTLQASNVIYLTDGFSAKQGCTFSAIIAPTSNTNGCPVPSSGQRNGAENNSSKENNLNRILAVPNPTTGKISFQKNKLPFKADQLQILDTYGRQVFAKVNFNSAKDAIDFSMQPNDIYVARCITNGEAQQVKFIVQR